MEWNVLLWRISHSKAAITGNYWFDAKVVYPGADKRTDDIALVQIKILLSHPSTLLIHLLLLLIPLPGVFNESHSTSLQITGAALARFRLRSIFKRWFNWRSVSTTLPGKCRWRWVAAKYLSTHLLCPLYHLLARTICLIFPSSPNPFTSRLGRL